MKKNALFILFGLLLGTLLGLGAGRWILTHQPKWVCNNACQNAITPDHRFFSDKLILVGETAPGEPFLLHLDLNRKRVADTLNHYYFADLIAGDQRKTLYTSFPSQEEAVQPDDFLTAFSADMAEDLSAREHVEFTFEFEDLEVSAQMDFNGDFLVKNTLDYTKFVNEGEASVTVNGQSLEMHAFLSRSYTPYYDRYVFFDGYSELESLAQFFVLWDEAGHFYLLDHSEVKNEMPDYKSHTWALSKTNDGLMKKAFAGTVERVEEGGVPQSWSIDLPDFDAHLELAPQLFVSPKEDNGLVNGTVETAEGVQGLQGYFSYHKY